MGPSGVVSGATKAGEHRRAARYRTRLRPCRILDVQNRFLVDCSLYDVSTTGARVRMVADHQVPQRVRLHDEQERTTREAQVVWRKQRELGLRFI
jgi:hypothetical protein